LGVNPLLARIQTHRSLPTLPHILLQLIEVCNRPEKGLKDLTRLINQDPALSERVLRLVNSAYYGLKQQITGIDQALLLLGTEAVKNVAITSSVCQVFHGIGVKQGLNLKRFWWHSVSCAVAARRLAGKIAYPAPDEAFLGGLLHDIGKIVLWTSFRAQYAGILKSSGERSVALLAAERRLGLTHPEAGAWLVGRWDLRSFMPDAIRYHHEPLERVARSFPLVRIVFAANLLCPSDPGAEARLTDAAQLLGLTAGELGALRGEAEEEARQTARSLEIEVEEPGYGEADRQKAEELSRLVRDYSLLAGIGDGLSTASGGQEVVDAVRRGLHLLFDLPRSLYFRLEGAQLVGRPPEEAGPELRVPFQEASGLLARSLARGEALDSGSRETAGQASIFDEQMARMLGGDGILCLPLRAEGQPLGVLAAGVPAAARAGIASRGTLLRLLAARASQALLAFSQQERRAAQAGEERTASATAMTRRVVHEAQNPLGVISNYLNILSSKLQGNAAVQEDLRIVREEIRRVSTTISELASYPAAPVREPVELNALLTDLARISREAMWENSRIRIQLALEPRLPPLLSDRDKLKQVFLNLIKNAAEAMPAGGNLFIQTRLSAEAPRRVEVLVRDEGGGIAAEVRSRVFDPFVSTKAQEGLGLSIARGIVQQLGGSIDFKTGSGGTTFRIELPVS
jgi:HD-like signal output (HDOD) protein/signal transduction histidine kinase